MKKINICVLLLSITSLFLSCASSKVLESYNNDESITLNTEKLSCEKLTIKSEPSDASVYKKESGVFKYIGKTPLTLSVDDLKSGNTELQIRKPYYQDKDFIINKSCRIGYTSKTFVIPEVYNKLTPFGIMNVKLQLTEDGKKELEKQEKQRKEEELQKQKLLNAAIGNMQIEPLEDFYFENPYGYEKGIAYNVCGHFSDIYVQQWFENGFIAARVPKEVTTNYPKNIKFYVKSIPNIKNVKTRITNVYMEYVGIEYFMNGFGTQEILPVFNILYYEYYN